MENVAQKNEKSISGAIKVDEKEVMEHLDGLVRKSVEDTLNILLNEEADAICNAGGRGSLKKISASGLGRGKRRKIEIAGILSGYYSKVMVKLHSQTVPFGKTRVPVLPSAGFALIPT